MTRVRFQRGDWVVMGKKQTPQTEGNNFIGAHRSPLERKASTHLFETTVSSSDKGHNYCQEERTSNSV